MGLLRCVHCGRCNAQCGSSLEPHELHPEDPLGLVLIVRTASESDTGDARAPSPRHRIDMIELEPCALLTSLASFAHERALVTIRSRTARFTWAAM